MFSKELKNEFKKILEKLGLDTKYKLKEENRTKF